MIDRIRHDIQHRLDQLHAEADKLRRALAALDPRGRERSTRAPRPAPPATRPVATPAAAKPVPAPTPTRPTKAAADSGSPARTAPGATKTKVLAALSADQALTAGDVAKATGLARPTVSTTLSKLSKTGEVVKAARGYRLPSSGGATVSAGKAAAAPAATDA